VGQLKYSEELVQKSINGDKQSLEKLIEAINNKIYNLSLRMLWNPSDAEDVSQEILIKVITNLSKFRMESKFSTWVYRIASNHLINTNKRGLENQKLSFKIFEKGIEAGFDTKEPVMVSEVDRDILAEELKISCTHAMLLCLDREQRIIFILSSMFGVSSVEGAFIMNITPETYSLM
jgi:RNA polymerase sigma factor (sigma-70 family)